MITQKQKAIIKYLKDGEKKKSQIVNRFKSWHYSNSSKYIGEILTSMVKKKIITRKKIGVYILCDAALQVITRKSNNQSSLF